MGHHCRRVDTLFPREKKIQDSFIPARHRLLDSQTPGKADPTHHAHIVIVMEIPQILRFRDSELEIHPTRTPVLVAIGEKVSCLPGKPGWIRPILVENLNKRQE